MTTQIFLVRHGPTTAASGVLAGSTELPLSGRGLKRLGNIAGKLVPIQHWYASPQLRARQTLDVLAGYGCSLPRVCYDERLREIDFGRWEMQSFADIAGTNPGLVDDWSCDYLDFVFPGGERVRDFIERVEAMADLFRKTKKERVAVVTHGGVIRTMICLVLGISPRNYLLFDVAPASLTILELHHEGGLLKALNL